MRKILSWVAVFFWIGLIFYLSSQVAVQSSKISTGVTEIIIEATEKFAPNSDLEVKSFSRVVRKNAHYFLYLILGILVLNALKRSGINGYKCFALATAICVLYAVSDEVHQLYVAGRGALFEDVIIDGAGVAVGFLAYILTDKVIRFLRKYKKRGELQ